MILSRIKHQYLSSWPVSLYERIWSPPSLFLLLKATRSHPLINWYENNIIIHVQVFFPLITWICGCEIFLLSILLLVLWVEFWMWFLALLLRVTINHTMISRIFALVYYHCCLLVLPPFPLLLPFFGSFLVFLPLWTNWLPFLVTYVCQVLCLHISLVQYFGFEQHHMLSHMVV